MNNNISQRDELNVAFALTNLGAKSGRYITLDQLSTMNKGADDAGTLLAQNFCLGEDAVNKKQTVLTTRKRRKKTFAQKLFDVISDDSNSDIIRWLPCGTAFLIVDKKRFAEEILPVYFKQSQFTSFTRKLTRWNFVRVPRGTMMGTYHHKFFKRSNPSLCAKMSCRPVVASCGAKKNSNLLKSSTLPTVCSSAPTKVAPKVTERTKETLPSTTPRIVPTSTKESPVRIIDETMAMSASSLPPLVNQDPILPSNNMMNLNYGASTNVSCSTSSINPLHFQSLPPALMEKVLIEQVAQAQENRRDYHLTQALIQMRRAREARLAASTLGSSASMVSSASTHGVSISGIKSVNTMNPLPSNVTSCSRGRLIRRGNVQFDGNRQRVGLPERPARPQLSTKQRELAISLRLLERLENLQRQRQVIPDNNDEGQNMSGNDKKVTWALTA